MRVRLLTEGIFEQLNVSHVNSAVYNNLITVLTLEKASKNTSVKTLPLSSLFYLNHEIHQRYKVQRQ